MHDFLSLTIREILENYRKKSFSPSEYWLVVEDRIAAVEPKVAALWAYDPESARAQAAASTERWQKGAPQGPLDGIPVSLKELIATKGLPVPLGTAASEPVPASEDAPIAGRMKEDGAVVFGKTTCPDYGMLSSGLSSFHDLSRNPWDTTQNPGGSSSGASAAAAASFGPLHIGTDIGGSIRLPAGWTGIYGLKPTNGRIPIDPYYTGRCAGPMTRFVDDAAYSMATLTRPDWRDATSLEPNSFDWLDEEIDVKGMVIGLMMDAGCGMPVDPEIKDAVQAAARRFEEAGARIVEVPGVLRRAMLDGLDSFWRAKFWAEIGDFPDERKALVLPYIFEWAKGGEAVSGADAVKGFGQIFEMKKACAALFAQVDAVLSPTSPVVSYPAEWASPLNDPQRPFEHIAFTVPWNMSEQPAASINCGFSKSGMPLGLQIIGPRYDDMRVLKLSRLFETWTGKIANWPELG